MRSISDGDAIETEKTTLGVAGQLSGLKTGNRRQQEDSDKHGFTHRSVEALYSVRLIWMWMWESVSCRNLRN